MVGWNYLSTILELSRPVSHDDDDRQRIVSMGNYTQCKAKETVGGSLNAESNVIHYVLSNSTTWWTRP